MSCLSRREIGRAAARRENGFMQSAADARRADERREARQENYREQDRKVDDHGAVMPRWVGASPEKATGTGGHPMPAVNGVDTITVSASALEVERRRGRRSAGGSEGGVSAGRAVGGLPPATAADGMDERRRLDMGLAEFSRPDPALAIRTRECVQRLRLGRPDANLIREATDLLGAWMDRLHDPRLIEQLTVTVA